MSQGVRCCKPYLGATLGISVVAHLAVSSRASRYTVSKVDTIAGALFQRQGRAKRQLGKAGSDEDCSGKHFDQELIVYEK